MDPWASAFGNIGADFEALMAPLLAPVTVSQIDPDSGSATNSVSDVPALKRVRDRRAFNAAGGELSQDSCRFLFRLSEVTWVPKVRDQVQEADATVWIATKVELIALNHLVALDVVVKQ